MDLYRAQPVDCVFLETVKNESKENPYPHQMTLLRPELIDLYQEHKLKLLTKENKDIALDASHMIYINPDYATLAKSGDSGLEMEKDKAISEEVSGFVSVMISQYFVSIVQHSIPIPVETISLTNSLHKRGINMRYLGTLCALLEKTSEFPITAFILLLKEEMVSRVVKKLLRRELHSIPAYKSAGLISKYLSELFSITGITESKLNTEITQQVKSRFRYDLTSDFWSQRTVSMLRSICIKVGIQIKARNYDLSMPQCITEEDILNLVPTLKCFQPGNSLAPDVMEHGRILASQEDKKEAGLEFMQQSIMLYEQVYGPIHPATGKAHANLAMQYFATDNKSAALRSQVKATIIAERTFGTDDPETLRQYVSISYLGDARIF